MLFTHTKPQDILSITHYSFRRYSIPFNENTRNFKLYPSYFVTMPFLSPCTKEWIFKSPFYLHNHSSCRKLYRSKYLKHESLYSFTWKSSIVNLPFFFFPRKTIPKGWSIISPSSNSWIFNFPLNNYWGTFEDLLIAMARDMSVFTKYP